MAEGIIIDNDPLKEVPTEDIPDMLFRMQSNFPLAVHSHEYVRTILKWKRKRPDLQMAILAPDGNYRLGIIFFTVCDETLNGSVYCHEDSEVTTMQKALATTKRVPIYNQKMTLLTCMTSISYEAIKPSVADWPKYNFKLFWLPWYCAREMEVHIPEGVVIKELRPEHATQINEVWPHRYPGSSELITDMIKLNFGLGVFRNDSLLSWAIHWFYGGVGAVQTLDIEKRKGYGRMVVVAITKKLGEMQIDVHMNVIYGNKVGEAFFKKLGFRYAFTSYWTDMENYEMK